MQPNWVTRRPASKERESKVHVEECSLQAALTAARVVCLKKLTIPQDRGVSLKNKGRKSISTLYRLPQHLLFFFFNT